MFSLPPKSACIASIVRVYVGSHVFEDLDYTWAYAFFIWN